MIVILWTNSLIEHVDGAFLLSMVYNSKSIMGDLLEVVSGAWLLDLSP